MAAAADNTYDLIPPHRPSLDDLGGAQKKNNAKYQPNPITQPTAEEWNLFAKFHAQWQAGFAAVLKFQLTHGVSPAIATQWQMGQNLVVLTPARNGAGDYSITWPSGSFPVAIHPGRGWIIAAGAYCQVEVQAIANGVRCKTYDAAGAAVDVNFIIEVF